MRDQSALLRHRDTLAKPPARYVDVPRQASLYAQRPDTALQSYDHETVQQGGDAPAQYKPKRRCPTYLYPADATGRDEVGDHTLSRNALYAWPATSLARQGEPAPIAAHPVTQAATTALFPVAPGMSAGRPTSYHPRVYTWGE